MNGGARWHVLACTGKRSYECTARCVDKCSPVHVPDAAEVMEGHSTLCEECAPLYVRAAL